MRINGFREMLELGCFTIGFTVKNTSGSGINIKPNIELSGYTTHCKYRDKREYVLEVEQNTHTPPYSLYVGPGEEKHFVTNKKYSYEFPFLWFKIYKINGKKFRVIHIDSGAVSFFRFYWRNDFKRQEIEAQIFNKIHDICNSLFDIWLYIRGINRNIKYKFRWLRSKMFRRMK